MMSNVELPPYLRSFLTANPLGNELDWRTVGTVSQR